jgi:uncharacterized protein YbbC (DUF1343 family)
MPFEVIGAPWIGDPAGLAEALNALVLPGIRFEPIRFTPTASVFKGEPLGGVRLVVTERELLQTTPMGLAIARVLFERYPANFRPAAIQNLLVNRSTIWALLRKETLARIWSWADADRASFLQRRASYLMY